MDALRVILAWTAFAVFHSLTVSEGYERLARRWMGGRAFDGYHRLLFHAVQLGGVAFLFWTPWDLQEFLGIRQWKRHRKGELTEPGRNDRLFAHKAYGVVRHPLYLGISSIFAFHPVQSRNTFVSMVVIILYFYVGTFFEERRMARAFGEEYRKYQDRVPRFLPLRWPR